MAQFLEFAANHPFLIAAAVGLATIIVVTEMRQRGGAVQLTPADAVRLGNKGAVFIDVRSRKDFDDGHILNAHSLPLDELEQGLGKIDKYRSKPVIVYCETGLQSPKAATLLAKKGFESVSRLRGGLRLWRQENLPLVRHT